MGFVGYIVKLSKTLSAVFIAFTDLVAVHIPVNNILVGAA
jgi:hypothetical protein